MWWGFFPYAKTKTPKCKKPTNQPKKQLACAHRSLLRSGTYVSEDAICAIHATTPLRDLTHGQVWLWASLISQSGTLQQEVANRTFCRFFFFKHSRQYRKQVCRDTLSSPVSILLDPASKSIFQRRGKPFVPKGIREGWDPATKHLSKESRQYKMMKQHRLDEKTVKDSHGKKPGTKS